MSGRRINRPVVEEKLLKALREGNTLTAASAYAGINRDTAYEWMEKDPAFTARVKEAEGIAEARNVMLIQKAAREGQWTAAAWWLERRRHEDWKKREEKQFTGKDGERLAVVFVNNWRASDSDSDQDQEPGTG